MFTVPMSVSDRRNPLKQQENEDIVGKFEGQQQWLLFFSNFPTVYIFLYIV